MFARLGLFLIVCSSKLICSAAIEIETPPRFDIEDIFYDHDLVLRDSAIVDCHFGGCKERHFSEYIEWLAVNDRLAPKDKYTGYRSMSYTCRAATSPDALTNIEVTGHKKIEPSEFESAITIYGSVLSCIDTSQTNCFSYSGYREGIINGLSSEFCEEKVLIVGYTETYYRVRSSKGPDWGENGYFRIMRGGNKCGIENAMFVIETEVRNKLKPGVDRGSGCPAQFPKYCPETKTCATRDQICIPPSPSRGRQKRSSTSSSGISLIKDKCSDHPGYPCASLSALCSTQRFWELCGHTCGFCNPDGTEKCTDTEDFEGECGSYKDYCHMVPAIKLKCQVTCKVPPSECESNKRGTPGIVRMDPPPTGNCFKPSIENGVIRNRRQFLKQNEKLMIKCNAGYTLIGDPVYCEIQNVFKPDTRRIPSCVKIGNENFHGRGEDYTGTRNFAVSGRSCDNWVKAAHLGAFRSIERGKLLLEGGNHNFCRNPGGDVLPFCFTQGGQLLEYCFMMPKCGGDENDKCSVPRIDVYNCGEDIIQPDCIFDNELSRNRKEWIWEKCGAMCCNYAGCQENWSEG
ncbi:hypothetical protein ACHWQZ_G012356 [Mnemiopsis leidyi]